MKNIKPFVPKSRKVVAMKKELGYIAAVLGALAAAETGISAYFYRRTMMRGNARTDRTIKMAGTDWSQYFPLIEKRKERMLAQPHRDVWIRSYDGLKLHGTFFPGDGSKKIVICFHGYTSEGMSDYIGLSDYYLKRGFAMLLVDERSHGKSEGKYIGFGCLDRRDALAWIHRVVEQEGEGCQILLHGISMGGSTVLMTGSLPLPPQVKGIVSDCGFTSPKEVFAHVLHSMYHLPAFPILPIADRMNRKLAGYGLDECNAAREVKKMSLPLLIIHGEKDTFVPCSMGKRIYASCASRNKRLLIVPGAAHAESYYKDMAAYEEALDSFTGGILK